MRIQDVKSLSSQITLTSFTPIFWCLLSLMRKEVSYDAESIDYQSITGSEFQSWVYWLENLANSLHSGPQFIHRFIEED